MGRAALEQQQCSSRNQRSLFGYAQQWSSKEMLWVTPCMGPPLSTPCSTSHPLYPSEAPSAGTDTIPIPRSAAFCAGQRSLRRGAEMTEASEVHTFAFASFPE